MTEINCDTLFLSEHIFTAQEGEQNIIHDAAIAVKDEHIVWVGSQSEIPESLKHASKVHQFEDGWITPGLIDCHTHIVHGGNRAGEFRKRLEGISYETIAREGGGIISTVKATRAASEESLFNSASKRLNVLMDEGVTTIEIKSGYGLDLQSEKKMLKVARLLGEAFPINVKTTLLAAHALPPEFKDRADDYIQHICDEIIPSVMNEHLADAIDAFCENIGFSASQVEKLFSVAQTYHLPIKLHAEQLSNQNGAKLAASFQALSADHLEYLDEAGVKAMAENNTVAVLLPGAYYFLRETQCPPIELLREYNVPIAIATDCNPGSSPCNSLLLMLNMACTEFRMTTEEVLLGVTKHAAQALGLQESHGQIKVGMKADFVHWSIDNPEDLAYYIGHNPCQTVVQNGVIVKDVMASS